MSLLQFGNSWVAGASEAGPPLAARAQSPSGNTEALVPEEEARGFRESGPNSTAPRPPVARDYKSCVFSASTQCRCPAPLLSALCPGPAMASTRARPMLPLLLVLLAVVIPGESEVGSLWGAGFQTSGGPRAW